MTVPTPEAWQAGGSHFQHRGHEIFFRDSEPGSVKPALLLIHGFPTASWDWHAVWDALAMNFRLLAPDLIGFGFSAKPADYTYSIHDQANLCAALCGRQGLGWVHVLAHDYGVSVAQELLARQQAGEGALRLNSIVFLNGGLFPETHRPRLVQKLLLSPLGPLVARLSDEAKFSRSFAAVFGANSQPGEAELRAFWQLIAYNDGNRIMHKLIRYILDRRQQRERWLVAMQATSVPLHLINGPDDPVSGAHMVARYRELIPKPSVTSLPGIGHYPQVEAAQQTLVAYLSFVKSRCQ